METRLIDAAETRPLRHQVLWPHIERVEQCIIDIDHASDAFHVGTFEANQLISVGSFFRMSSSKLDHSLQYRLRAMATSPLFRGRNSGKELIEFALSELRLRHVQVLWCDARLNATGFYSKLGFSQLDEIYDIPRIGPHKFMWIEL